MTNNDQSTFLLYCCEDVKSHRSGGGIVPLTSWRFAVDLSFTSCLLYT